MSGLGTYFLIIFTLFSGNYGIFIRSSKLWYFVIQCDPSSYHYDDIFHAILNLPFTVSSLDSTFVSHFDDIYLQYVNVLLSISTVFVFTMRTQVAFKITVMKTSNHVMHFIIFSYLYSLNLSHFYSIFLFQHQLHIFYTHYCNYY